MLWLCDDILCVIIAFLDNECIILARVCKRWHRIVHDVHKTMLITHNVFEAMRCGSMLSLKHAKLPINADITPNIHTDVNMLMSIYNKLMERNVDAHNEAISNVVYRLCKAGKLIFESKIYHKPSLIIHAITHGKRDLLKYMKDKCDRYTYEQYCAYGYAKIGDYEMFMLYYYPKREDGSLRYYACVGRNEQIISTVNANIYHQQCAMVTHYRDEALLLSDIVVSISDCAKRLIKRDDYELFTRVGRWIYRDIIRWSIKYNALKIMRYIGSINIDLLRTHIYESCTINDHADITIEMAKLLLELTRDDSTTVNFIVTACNYRLTEILRARGLYNKQLTMKSSVAEFVI